MLNVGLIGAGRIGRVHARSVAANAGATLRLVADPVLAAAESLAEAHGARAGSDVDAIFSDPEVDAVIICSPTPLHVDHIVAAAKAGKPALCEKPVAMDLAAVDELQGRLAGLEPLVMMGFQRRFDPSFRRVHDLVSAGEVGPVEQVTIVSRDPAAPPAEYIAVSGGIFKDMTIHDFDMARYLLGDIVAVSAVGQHLDPALADTGDFDGAVITLVSAQGAVATITNSRHCATGYDQRVEVFGPRGSLAVENLRATTVRRFGADASSAEDPYLDFFLTRYEAAYARELDEFIAAIAENRAPTPTIADGVAALRIAEAAAASANSGAIVRL
ncbi:inositol 2-dehydrogenase [Propionicicella superfundia]|uniref:inositol 2-dehydrogenase n=1 Tax=Propionicicella superfundia TaxID=348582 RepID=UPI00040662BF|nr:inositol 2-dehydrogenase [Propionicicella superfundia]